MEQKTSDNPPVKRAGRINWVVVGIVAAVVAALVFAGGTLAANRLAAPERGEGDFGNFRPEFQIQPAKELPTDTPALRGVVVQRTGNTLSVGQRGGLGGGNGGGNGNTTLMDVVIDANTTIYHDTTQMNFNGQQPSSGSIQQTVEPGKVNGINTNSRVTVWGTQSGNQITAKVLVYSDPMIFRQPQ